MIASQFGQLISLIDDKKINDAVKNHDSDRYVKQFKSKDHLISMLFCSFDKCNSLREVSGAMLGLSGKTESFQLGHIPKRSTLSDANKNRKVEFLTNLFDLRADLKAGFYKIRWQIKLLFKQLKQNFPLRYFLGYNENAIKIQIYCVLIVNLLIAVIKKKLKRSWAFSNLVSFCKIHLFLYVQLMKYLETPEKDWVIDKKEIEQL